MLNIAVHVSENKRSAQLEAEHAQDMAKRDLELKNLSEQHEKCMAEKAKLERQVINAEQTRLEAEIEVRNAREQRKHTREEMEYLRSQVNEWKKRYFDLEDLYRRKH